MCTFPFFPLAGHAYFAQLTLPLAADDMRNVQVSKSSSTQPSRLQRGFTLIEVMIVVAIVAILAAVAIPNYRDYVLRGQLVDASSLLSTFRANMERYYQDNRQYTNISATIVAPCDGSVPVAQRTQGKFIVTCSAVAANTYTLLAQGQGSVLNFNFTVDQTGGQATPSVGASGWSTSTTCWVMKKGQVC